MTKPLKVSDVSQPDTSTQFISDVQLSTFYDDSGLNGDLMQRFMFTRGSGGHSERKGTADLLRSLHQTVTALGSTNDNRFVFIATYGHGKSHLGLALANYFGAAQDSPALGTVLNKLDHALPAHEAQVFREYRANKPPFLVLLLRGDRPGGLRDNFFQALDIALKHNEQARDAKPPFWFEKADELLANLQRVPTDAVRANAFLAEHGRDLSSLRQEIRERHSSAYRLATGAFRAVHGVEPNIGGETALNEAVNWLMQDLCGPGKPFGGLLVLFDEFSGFVEAYKQRNPIGSPLQELLSGFSHPSARGQALFVGLSQHDPDTVADRSEGGQDLIKELNRIPTANRHRMQTMLEDVLGGVLKTNDAVWKELMGDQHFANAVGEASDTAGALFAERYGQKQLNWNSQELMNRLARQCFPMHPLTTAFLSSVTLHSSGTVRSVLGFIQDQEGYVMPHFAQSARTGSGRPNWVLPIRLVDYFGAALGEEKYTNFRNVIKPDLTDEQQAVLKAMLLLDVAELPTRDAGGYAAVVANLAGIEEAAAKRTLNVLVEQHYIRYDSANGTYSFWVGSNGALDLDRMLGETLAQRQQDRKLAGLFETFTGGTNAVNNLGLGQEHPVAVPWGHPDDWAAREVLAPVVSVRSDLLAALRNKYAVPLDKAPEMRGVVVLVIPRTQQEANEAPALIREALQQSSHDHAAPLLFLVAKESQGDLHTNLLKLVLLSEPLFKSQAQPKVGQTVLDEVRISLEARVAKALEDIRQAGELIVPPAISQALAARSTSRLVNRTGDALKTVMELAYPQHPDSFFTQFKANAPTLNRAVVDVIYELLHNNLDNVTWAAGAKLPLEVVRLLQKEWGIINPQKQIVEPTLTRAKAAWERFDGAFSPKIRSAPAGPVLRELLQTPYGYDQNTLGLLFAAWLGRNRDAVAIQGIGKLSRPAPGSKEALKNAGLFLKLLENREIHRKDTEGARKKIQEVLTQLKDRPFGIAEAKRNILDLEDFTSNNPSFDSSFLEQVESGIGKLKHGLENQAAYEKAAESFEVRLSQARTVAQLEPLSKQLQSGLPPLTTVTSEKPGVDVLQQQLVHRATGLAGQEIRENTTLKDWGAYTKQLDALKALAKALYQLNLPDLKAQAEAAQETLKQAKQALEVKQAEEAEMSIVNSIATTGNLVGLRQSMEALRSFDPKSDRASQIADQKYEQLQAGIKALEGHLPAWGTELDAVLDVQRATALSRTLLAENARYEDTPEAEQLTILQGRASALGAYFAVLTETPRLRQPEDVQERRAALDALPGEYGAGLTETQCDLVVGAQESLNAQERQLQTEAEDWLATRQQKFSSGQTKNLERELDTPPSFLSDAGHAALGELRAALRSQQDAAAQEEQHLAIIAALPHTGSVQTLRGSLSRLDTMVLSPGRASEAAEQRRRAAQDNLDRLLQRPGLWAEQLDRAADSKKLDDLAAELARQETNFEDSEQADKVRDLLGRARALSTTFRTAAELRSQKNTLLRDLNDRWAAQQRLLGAPGLSAAQREALDVDVVVTERLLTEQHAHLESALREYATRLGQALTAADLDRVDFSRFPRSGLPERLSAEVQGLEQRRSDLRAHLTDGQDLDRTRWSSLTEAQDLLAQYSQLLTVTAWSDMQRQHIEQRRSALFAQVQGKRAEAASWLSEREQRLSVLDGPGLARLQDELERPHAFLGSEEEQQLGRVRTNLQARLQEDQALQIETLFSKIESPERRAILIQRLQGMMALAAQT